VPSNPDAKSLMKQITEMVNSIPKEEYEKTFQKWIEKMQKIHESKSSIVQLRPPALSISNKTFFFFKFSFYF